MEHLQELTKEVLENGYLLSLGTTDSQGVWVADVIYTFDDNFNVYWISSKTRRHSMAVASSPIVAGTITVADGPDDPDNGLQISGRVDQMSDISFELVKKYFRKRNKPEPKAADDYLGEHVWYKLTAERIELLYEPEFGYDRQKVR